MPVGRACGKSGYIEEANDLLSATPKVLKAAGAAPPAPSTPAERLTLWCDRLPSPAPEMLRTLAAQGERYMEAEELAAAERRSLEFRDRRLAQQRADRDQTCPRGGGGRPPLPDGHTLSGIAAMGTPEARCRDWGGTEMAYAIPS
jgi:hypothetical protein